jgi:hypothetical protein
MQVHAVASEVRLATVLIHALALTSVAASDRAGALALSGRSTTFRATERWKLLVRRTATTDWSC